MTGPVHVAMVTDAELMSSVAIIRSLGRAGWTVIAASKDPRAPGFKSRYTTVPVVAAGAAELLAAARRHRVEVLIPVTDETLLEVSPVRDELPPGCRLATADPAALQTSMDKLATLELARKLEIPLPDTVEVCVSSADPRAAQDLGWPVVVKPRFSRVQLPDGSVYHCSTSYAFDEGELAAQLAMLPPGSSALLQRYHRGVGESVCLLTSQGQALSAFAHRRIREVPPSGGVSSLRESVAVDPALGDYAMRLLEAMDWTGIAMVEFKVGDGPPLLMEVNGRVWGSLPLATRAGMDFPRQLAELFLGSAPAQNGRVDMDYRVGVRARRLGLELDWVEAVLRGREQPPLGPRIPRREALKAAAQLFDPRLRYDGIVRGDLRPGLADAAVVLRLLATRGKRLLRG